MAKDPAVLLYTSDFLTGTQHFTNEEVGFYFRLLAGQHQRGALNIEYIERIGGAQFEKLWRVVKEKFKQDSNGEFFNKRMRDEVEKRKKYSKSRSDNRLKKKDVKNISQSYVPHMENENVNINTDKNNSRDYKESKVSNGWNAYPTESDRAIELTKVENEQCQEWMYRLKQQQYNYEDITQFWKAFTLQNFTGEKFYKSRSECISHFRNWIKDIKPYATAKKSPTATTVGKRQTGAHDLLDETKGFAATLAGRKGNY